MGRAWGVVVMNEGTDEVTSSGSHRELRSTSKVSPIADLVEAAIKDTES